MYNRSISFKKLFAFTLKKKNFKSFFSHTYTEFYKIEM